jgi:predicted nucleotidyltransferase component of viral defense system
MSGKDYRKLYRIQDKLLLVIKPVISSFYLTGGTALGRFYLNHRFSDDLDFFINKNDHFQESVKDIEKVLSDNFHVLKQESILFEGFGRYYIEEEETVMKIEFVNNVAYRCGMPVKYTYGLIDTPLNILANKLTAIVGRDEPKDIFDIYSLALKYSYNWMDVFTEARNKAVLNEIDIEQRIKSFPVTLLQQVDWTISPVDIDHAGKILQLIANDLLLGADNSPGKSQPSIKVALPVAASFR